MIIFSFLRAKIVKRLAASYSVCPRHNRKKKKRPVEIQITYMAEIATPKYATPIVPPTGALSKMSSANNGEQATDMANRIVVGSGTMRGQMATEGEAK